MEIAILTVQVIGSLMLLTNLFGILPVLEIAPMPLLGVALGMVFLVTSFYSAWVYRKDPGLARKLMQGVWAVQIPFIYTKALVFQTHLLAEFNLGINLHPGLNFGINVLSSAFNFSLIPGDAYVGESVLAVNVVALCIYVFLRQKPRAAVKNPTVQ